MDNTQEVEQKMQIAQKTQQKQKPVVVEQKNFMKPQFDDAIGKREQFAVSLRKKKTQQAIKAKRRKLIEAQSKGKGEAGIQQPISENISIEDYEHELYQGYPQWHKSKYSEQKAIVEKIITDKSLDYNNLPQIEKFKFLLYQFSGQEDNYSQLQQLALISQLRKEVCDCSKQKTLNIKDLIQKTMFLPLMSSVVAQPQSDQFPLVRYIQLEATWILTNLTYGDSQDIEMILSVEYHMIDFFNQVLVSDDLQMIDQIIWILANTAGESTQLRNIVLSQTDVIDGLTRLIVNTQTKKGSLRLKLLENIIWCVRNLSRTDFKQQNNLVKQLSPEQKHKLLYIVQAFLDTEQQSQALIDVVYSIQYLIENEDDNIIDQICQNQNVTKLITDFLKSSLEEENQPTIKVIGHILSSANPQNIDIYLFHGVLDAINSLITQEQAVATLKDLLWCISNITAGTDEQIKVFLSNQNLLDKIFFLMKSQNYEVRRESIIVMTNLLTTCQDLVCIRQVADYQDNAILQIFVQALQSKDMHLIMEVLQSVYILLQLDEAYKIKPSSPDSISYKFELNNGLDQLEELQTNPNQLIYKEVQRIVTDFFKCEESL